MSGKANFKLKWRRMKDSPQFHNGVMFLIFIAIATIFWFVVALNDNITETFTVRLNIQGVPDTVTFITDPPADIHVTLRDKGTNILRSGVVKNPTVDLNFRDYARNGVFRLSASDLNAELKADLGGAAQIASVSIDSLRLLYTTGPGKRVPVVVEADLTAASGYIIPSAAVALTKAVRVYSYGNEIDTIHKVRTKRLIKRNLSQNSDFRVDLQQIPGVKVVPSHVDVRVKVEPLVHKDTNVEVEIINAPEGVNLLLFPSQVPVSFYVPMSHFNDTEFPLEVAVDYNDIHHSTRSRLPVKILRHAPSLINVELRADSLEYTIVR